MAMSVHLYLNEDGNQIEGESTVASEDRENSIECLEYQDVFSREWPGGKVTASPISIVKRIDKSSPILYDRLEKGGPLEGEFRFFRASASGDGTVEHYLTVTGSRGRVVEVTRISDAFGQGGDLAASERVEFLFDAVKVEYTQGGIIGEIEFKAAKK